MATGDYNSEPKIPDHCLLIRSMPHLLLLDLDTQEQVQRFVSGLEFLGTIMKIERVWVWASQHGRTHAVVRMKRSMPMAYRVALQASLGSDPKREQLWVKKSLMYGREYVSVLFKPMHKKVVE